MLNFCDEYYRELAAEISEQINGRDSMVCGAVELHFGRFEVIFGFDYKEHIQRWLLLIFENGVRCSSDFTLEKLEQWL